MLILGIDRGGAEKGPLFSIYPYTCDVFETPIVREKKRTRYASALVSQDDSSFWGKERKKDRKRV